MAASRRKRAPKRRKFTDDYKSKIVREARDRRSRGLSVAQMLKREGLYSSHLSAWDKRVQGWKLGNAKRVAEAGYTTGTFDLRIQPEHPFNIEARAMMDWMERAQRAQAAIDRILAEFVNDKKGTAKS